jgi:hypothetical protein
MINEDPGYWPVGAPPPVAAPSYITAAGYITTMPRADQERVGKIRMHPSGRYVDPFDLKVEDIDIGDIAHHLSIVNRFTGGSPFPDPVAQHSVRVCDASVDPTVFTRETPPAVQLRAHERRLAHLLHDAAEAYLNDLASPVKKKPGMEVYVAAHLRAELVIFAAFGLDIALMPTTKELDDADFRLEAATFFSPHEVQRAQRIEEIPWRTAKRNFLARFNQIVDRIQCLQRQIAVEEGKVCWPSSEGSKGGVD